MGGIQLSKEGLTGTITEITLAPDDVGLTVSVSVALVAQLQ
jgi:hypothetical protein